MSCIERSQEFAQDAFNVSFTIGVPIASVTSVICGIALLILLGNFLRSATLGILYENYTVLNSGVVNGLWSLAKWSGIATIGALAPIGILLSSSLIPCPKACQSNR